MKIFQVVACLLKMTNKILALKYRPQNFTDLIGQEVMAQTITNAIKLGSIVSSLLIFLFLLELLGLWICLGLLILSNMIILGQRKPVPTISMSFAFPFICWLAVEKGLGITIPL